MELFFSSNALTQALAIDPLFKDQELRGRKLHVQCVNASEIYPTCIMYGER
jgi:hypothetical protein